jgi:hypothetical protein
VAGGLELDGQLPPLPRRDLAPPAVGEGDDEAFNALQGLLDQAAVAGDADLEGVFEHQGEENGARLAAQDGSVESGGEQPGNAPDVVEMDVGDDQGADVSNRKIDLKP